MRLSRRSPPVYPKLTLTNLTNEPLYVGIKTQKRGGLWLGPSGSGSESLTVSGVDLSDKRTIDTLKTLITGSKISVTVAETLDTALGIS
ncbi:MAG: hypothetical protein KatS3mg087_0120 [Patescibacteria group bacterium]|nr:MAG: hypothetical protein KatS3mg087_0120 [Patescibacteria group bacterium]